MANRAEAIGVREWRKVIDDAELWAIARHVEAAARSVGAPVTVRDLVLTAQDAGATYGEALAIVKLLRHLDRVDVAGAERAVVKLAA